MLKLHQEFIEILLSYIAKVQAAWEPGLRICIVAGPGHGDHARAIAFCDAVRPAYWEARIFLLMRFTAAPAMVEYDMAHHAKVCGVVNDYYCMQQVEREPLLLALREKFDVVFDCVPYPVKAYWNAEGARITACNRDDAAEVFNADDWLRVHRESIWQGQQQAEADQRLAPFAFIQGGHPTFNHMLHAKTLSVWDIMSMSSGLAVTPDSLTVAMPLDPESSVSDDLAPWPEPEELGTVLNTDFEPDGAAGVEALKNSAGSSDEKLLDLGYVGDYVLVHNAAGRESKVKEAPAELFKTVVSFLEQVDVRCVQVGGPRDELIDRKKVIDRRGLRLPLTCRLLKDALGVVTIEGFMAYVAAGCCVPALVFFGPTPHFLFGMEQNVNVPACPGQLEQPCPLAPCGMCFQIHERWASKCTVGPERNKRWPHCMNFVGPKEAGLKAVAFVKGARMRRQKEPVA